MADVKNKPVVKPVQSTSGLHYLPKLVLLFGVLLMVIAVVDYYKYFIIDARIIDLLLLLAGLWLIKIAFEHGLYKRRKELLKKYI